MIRRPPRSTLSSSSAASDVYKRQVLVDATDPGVRTDVVDAATAVREAALGGDAVAALEKMERHRLLCAHRTGPRGVLDWSRQIELWLAELHGTIRQAEW